MSCLCLLVAADRYFNAYFNVDRQVHVTSLRDVSILNDLNLALACVCVLERDAGSLQAIADLFRWITACGGHSMRLVWRRTVKQATVRLEHTELLIHQSALLIPEIIQDLHVVAHAKVFDTHIFVLLDAEISA